MLNVPSDRVERNTAPAVIDRIHRRTSASVAYYSEHPDEISHRLGEIDREWDIERTLETMSASFSLAGLLLGLAGSRRWFLLPLVVQGFFLQHAVQGWCPPLPVLRSLGFRTAKEVYDERTTLRRILAGRGNGVRERPGPEDLLQSHAPGQ